MTARYTLVCNQCLVLVFSEHDITRFELVHVDHGEHQLTEPAPAPRWVVCDDGGRLSTKPLYLKAEGPTPGGVWVFDQTEAVRYGTHDAAEKAAAATQWPKAKVERVVASRDGT